MKKLLAVMFAVLALAFTAGAWATCGDVDAALVEKANSIRAEAIKAADAGDYDTAAVKYQAAAEVHPKDACKASLYANAEGALVGTRKDSNSGWEYKHERGGVNAKRARELLTLAQEALDRAKAARCKCSNTPFANTQAWIDNASKFLKKMTGE